MNNTPKPAEYQTLPLELWTITDLTDALTVEASADLLKTTKRAIYTIRNTDVLAIDRRERLIGAVRENEDMLRRRLMVLRNAQHTRASKRDA
jgi:hypothetical protein